MSANTIPSKLSEINIAFCYDNRSLKLQHVTSANDAHLFLHHYPTLSTDTMVLCHGAVFSTLKMLAHKGDFVLTNSEVNCSHPSLYVNYMHLIIL